MARTIPMVAAFEMGAKTVTHEKNVIKSASDAAEQRVSRRSPLHFRQLRSIYQHHIVGLFHITVSIEGPRCRIAKDA